MLTDRGRRVSICIGTLDYGHRKFRGNGCYGGFVDRSSERCRDWSPSSTSRILRISSPTTSPPSATSPVSLNGSYSNNGSAGGYIEHRVSKFDTLAGIAIKYGVEVADITKLNGLVTDLQMFALKSLRIPLPGRHPPSPCLSNSSFSHGEDCSEQVSSCNGNLQDVFDPFQSLRETKKISPAMDSLQGYYGLKPTNRRASEASHLQDNDQYLKPFPATSTPLNQHRKSRSLVDAVIAEVNQSSSNGYNKEVDSADKPIRRRQKSEADFISRTPEPLLKKESRSSSSGVFSAIAGKGLALRPKAAASRTNSPADTNGNTNPVPINLMDAPLGDSFSSVRKSFSASILQEPVNKGGSSSSSLWTSSKWTLKADLLQQAAMARSIFDGLPKPLTGRRNKKAM